MRKKEPRRGVRSFLRPYGARSCAGFLPNGSRRGLSSYAATRLCSKLSREFEIINIPYAITAREGQVDVLNPTECADRHRLFLKDSVSARTAHGQRAQNFSGCAALADL